MKFNGGFIKSKKEGMTMLKLIVSLCLIIIFLAMGFSSEAAPLIIKFGHSGTKVHQYHIGATKLAEAVERNSGGKMKIEVFPDAQLGGERDLAEGTRLGTVDMAVSAAGSVLPLWVPEFQVVEMPFIFRDRPHTYKVLDGPVGAELNAMAEKKGIKVLGYWEVGFRNMTNNKRPIVTPKDMQGLKIRVQQSKVYIEMMKSLGAIGTPIAFTELYSALQQGVVDGQENPIPTIRSMNYFEVQKYLSLTFHTYTPGAVMISQKIWNSLNEEQKQILQKSVDESKQFQRKTVADKETDDLAFLKSKGMIVTEKPDVEAFRKATTTVYEAMADVVPPALVKKIKDTK
jgi:tripartite ATP-independent transporter DctP family solute receptor